jgi:putative sigma-54 modulation protein
MNYIFTNKNVKIEDVDRDMIRKKFTRLERFFKDDSEAHVVLRRERGKNIVGVTILYRGIIFRSEAAGDTSLDATDACIIALSRQIRKNKTKLSHRIHAAENENYGSFFEEEEPDEEIEFDIGRSKKIPSKPMMIEEAILQMNMLGHNFFLFKNADTFLPTLIYRRKSGNYGIIEMEK